MSFLVTDTQAGQGLPKADCATWQAGCRAPLDCAAHRRERATAEL